MDEKDKSFDTSYRKQPINRGAATTHQLGPLLEAKPKKKKRMFS